MADMTEHHVAAAHHMLGTKSGKMGPLPVWAWGAILGVGVAAWLYFHNKSASATPVNPSATGAVLPDLTANDLGSAGNLASGGANSAAADTSNTTNAQWIAQGVAYMIGRGRNPITTQQALDRYIAGSELTWDQSNNYVTPVVTKFGLPPDGVQADSKIDPKPAETPSPVHTGPAPHPGPLPKSKPKPVHKTRVETVTEWHPITIKWGDTLAKLAIKYHTSVSVLASKNHISNPNKIYAGHRLYVPVQVHKTVAA